MVDFTYAVRGKADLAPIKRAFDEARDEFGRFVKQSEKTSKESKKAFEDLNASVSGSISSLRNGFAALSAAVGAGKLIASFADATAAGGQFAAQQSDMAAAVGESVETFSATSAALARFGVDTEATFDVLGELQQRAVNIPDDFKRWEIATKDVNGEFLTSSELLANVADRMSKASTATEQLALADELLNDNGRKLVPILRQGGAALRALQDEARAAGQVITEYEAVANEALVRRQRIAEQQTLNLSAAVSASLAPALTILTEEIGNGRAQLTEWIRENQELIASGIDTFFAQLGQVWIPRIVQGFVFLTRGARGFAVIFNFLEQAGAAAFENIAEGAETVLSLAARAARAMGQDGLAGELESMATIQADVAKEFRKDQAALQDELEKSIEAQIRLEAEAREMGKGATEAVERIRRKVAELRRELLAMPRATKTAGDGFVKLGDDGEKAADKLLKAQQKSMKGALERFDIVFEYEEEQRRARDEAETEAREKAAESAQERIDTMTGYFEQGSSLVADLTQQAIDGNLTLADAIAQVGQQIVGFITAQLQQIITAKATEQAVTASTATANITAKAADTAAGAASAVSSIPVLGPALAVAAIGTILPLVLSLANGFNTGGIVGGAGPTNRDSVLIGATPGEAVLDVETTRRLANVVAGRGNLSSSSPTPVGASATRAPTGSVTFQSMMPPTSRMEQRRIARRLDRYRGRA